MPIFRMPVVLHANCPHVNRPHANSPHANCPATIFMKVLASLGFLSYLMKSSKHYVNRFGKYNVNYLCLKRKNIFHSKTVKLQCKDLTSIHVVRRGQSPNNRMMIMRNYITTLCFVGEKNKRQEIRRVCALC